MAINPLYIPLFNIEEVILDKDSGLPLAGGVVTFYRDSQRLTPKVVYQIAGVSPNYTFASVGAQLTLGLSGTFVDQDGDPFVPYAYPYDSEGELDLYYVTVVSSGGVPQFVRQAVPYVDTGGVSPSERTSTDNEISNPQFVDINFIESGIATISVTGSDTVTSIAPDWDVITSGTGTLTLERLQPISANVVTNPPFALRIEGSAGLGSTIQLRQRFLNTPSIFRNGYISASLTAAVISGGGSFISMTYAPSTGSSTQIIPSTSIPTDGAYHTIANNAAIPDQANPPAATGYTDIIITLPTVRNIAITSIQVLGSAISVDLPFDEQTAARQRDHLAHYYKPLLANKPIPSFTVGWDFKYNPFQEKGTAPGTIVPTSSYIADQTILFQTVNSGVSPSLITQGLQLGIISPTSCAIIQYLDAKTAVKLLNGSMSVKLRAQTSASTLGGTVSLWWTTDASLPSISANTSLVSAITAGVPTCGNGSWTQVLRQMGNSAPFTLTNSLQSFDFTGFDSSAVSGINSATYIAIIVCFDTFGAGNNIAINYCSLVQGGIAAPPSPLNAQQTLAALELYYEKSFATATPVPTSTLTNANVEGMEWSTDGAFTYFISNAFSIVYNAEKRAVPNIAIYSGASTTPDRVEIFMPTNVGTMVPAEVVVSSNWTVTKGTKITNLAPSNQSNLGVVIGAAVKAQPWLTYQYAADARFGVV